MNEEKRSAEERAWDVASDPSASEKMWMNACTILDGKKPPSRKSSSKLPQSIGLPWSLCVSGVSGLGAFMIFGFLSAAVCDALAILTGAFYTFNGPHAFALLSAAFIAFSSIFTYQQHIWGGGRVWSVLHYGLVACGALLPFSLELFLGSPAAFGNFLLFAIWGVGFIGLSAMSAKLTRDSIKRLESTVGADRVMPHSRLIFASAGALLLGLTAMPMLFTVVTSTWLWLPLLLIGSGFYIASINGARNPQTASTLALAAWSPLLLANVVLGPALIANSIYAFFYPLLQIGVADYVVGFGTMLCIAFGPLIGARIASYSLRRTRELELHHMPEELFSERHSALCKIDSEDPMCETT